MIALCRTIRFCLAADGSLDADAPRANTFAAWPPMRGLGRYYELEVTCRGEADAVTGYFMNIKRIDEAARRIALPMISDAARGRRPGGTGELMRDLLRVLDPPLQSAVAAVTLRLTPTYSLTIEAPDMNRVLIQQQYDFAAAHRLHVAALSDEENRRYFGKCNNPAGHGHNYRVEVSVRSPIDDAGDPLPIGRIDEVVDRAVIRKLDHKNLDEDVEQFSGVNSSVENIARVIYHMLRDEIRLIGGDLEHIRVWETAKTACTYPA